MLTVCPNCNIEVPAEASGVCPGCFLLELGQAANQDDSAGFSLPGIAIQEEIARGGVGIVYRGQQANPQRQLAVKVLQPRWARDKTIRNRFRREAQTMVALDHPVILPVYEVGEDYGLPWFSMKLATGGSLAERVTQYRGHWHRIAELITLLADALDFAHRRCVLHRDIKPGNVLFDGDERAYLGDFGLATEGDGIDSQQTLMSDVLGTPHYLSPEVAAGGMNHATTASDVYGLGAVLYELLASRAPHRADSLPALLREIADASPEALSEMVPMPPRDLTEICMRAMEKEPRHRYATAGEFAEDLRRFLSGRTTRARPVGRLGSSWRWCRRHPTISALAASVLFLLGALGVGSNVAAWRIESAHESAEKHWREELLSQAASLRAGRPPGFRDRALKLVEEAASVTEDPDFRIRRRSELMCALAFPTVTQSAMPTSPDLGMDYLTASPGWKFLVWRNHRDGSWKITRSSGVLHCSGQGPGSPKSMSADGSWVATAEHDKHWKLSHIEAGNADGVLQGQGSFQEVSADGHWLSLSVSEQPGRRLAQIRETATGRITLNFEYPDIALAMRFSPDGQFCAVAPSFYLNNSNAPYSVRIYRCSDGALIHELAATLGNCVWCMTWSPDGRSLLAAERDGPVYIWDTQTGTTRHILRGPATQLWDAAFSQDGQRLATISEDELFTVFCLVSGRILVQGKSSLTFSHGFQWQSDDSFGPIAVDGRKMLVHYHRGAYCGYKSIDTRGGVLGIAASPDGRWTALGDARHAWLWDHSRQQECASFASGLWNSFLFSPDGHQLFGAGELGITRWEVADATPSHPTQINSVAFHNSLAIDRNGQLLAGDREGGHGTLLVRNPASESPNRSEIAPALALPSASWLDISPNGRFLAAGGKGGLNLLDLESNTQLHTEKRAIRGVRFSPDSRWLLIAFDRFEVWSTETWTRTALLETSLFSPVGSQAAFHPSQPVLATGLSLGRIALWSTKDWHLLGVLENPSEIPVRRMSFEANGNKLHFGSLGGIFATWDFNLLEQELGRRNLGW